MGVVVGVLVIGLLSCGVAIGTLLVAVRRQNSQIAELLALAGLPGRHGSAGLGTGLRVSPGRIGGHEDSIGGESRLDQAPSGRHDRSFGIDRYAVNLDREPTGHGNDEAFENGTGDGDPIAVITGIGSERGADLDLGRVASVTFAGPLLKVAAFSYGVRHALDGEYLARVRYAMRRELKRQRKSRRRQRTRPRQSEGWL